VKKGSKMKIQQATLSAMTINLLWMRDEDVSMNRAGFAEIRGT
jgi:hypothetical protein